MSAGADKDPGAGSLGATTVLVAGQFALEHQEGVQQIVVTGPLFERNASYVNNRSQSLLTPARGRYSALARHDGPAVRSSRSLPKPSRPGPS